MLWGGEGVKKRGQLIVFAECHARSRTPTYPNQAYSSTFTRRVLSASGIKQGPASRLYSSVCVQPVKPGGRGPMGSTRMLYSVYLINASMYARSLDGLHAGSFGCSMGRCLATVLQLLPALIAGPRLIARTHPALLATGRDMEQPRR